MPLMRLFHVVRSRLRAVFHSRALDRELDEELRYHVERSIEANVARGLTPDDARRAAWLAIGGIERRKEECRDTRRVGLLHDLQQDVRYAIRTLRRAPSFTLAALLTLTLGIGASVAVFSVVNGVLLRPLPFPEADRLLLVAMSPRNPFIREPMLSDRNYLALREHDRAFQHLASYSKANANLTNAGEPAVIAIAGVTPEFFPALGVPAALGRVFLPDEGAKGGEPVVVLSDRLWRGRFAADGSVVGRQVTLDGVQHLVVGVMPAGFDFPARIEAWTARTIVIDGGNSFMFPAFGRLKAGISIAEARAQYDAIIARLPQQPDANRAAWQIGLLPLKESVIAKIRRPLQLFAGAVVCVLLIACANVANLLLARAANREHEIGVRAALGATRARLVRQLLTESSLLALAGGALGLLLAQWSVPALLALAPEGRIPRMEMIRTDAWVVAFAIAAALATGLTFGLVPALRATRRQLTDSSLAPGVRTFGGGRERLRAVLAVSEIALALVLLAGAGLMLRSFVLLRAVDSGFNTSNTLAVNLELPGSVYATPEKLRVFHQDLLARLDTVPDIVSAGWVNWLPLGTMHLKGDFRIEGLDVEPGIDVDKPAISEGYFRAMGIQLLRGRDFEPRDTASSLPVAIVSRSAARLIDPSGDATGKRVALRGNPRADEWLTIVGVVDDVKQWGPSQESRPAIYQHYQQVQQPMFLRHVSYVVRTSSEPLRAVPAIRAALRAVDRDQPATSIVLMDDLLASATAEPGFIARLLGAFASLAVVLALIGTYGVLAYSVAQRTHELGLRLALGARASAILWMVLRRTLLLTAAGVALGVVGAVLTTRFLGTFLFETTPTDPATFAAVTIAIFVAALAAGWVPARRATRVDPLVALRHE